MAYKEYLKNRDRCTPTFANINFIGCCNAKCFFCIGEEAINKCTSMFNKHWSEFNNLDTFLELCKNNNITKLYLTGLDSEPSLYKYLDSFVDYLKSNGFTVGIRSNGLKILNYKDLFNDEISISIHSLCDDTNKKIGISTINIDELTKALTGTNHRFAILVNRYNKDEVLELIKTIATKDNYELKYIQLRQVCTDYNEDKFKEDINAFNELASYIDNNFTKVNSLFGNNIYNVFGVNVSVWQPLQSSVNSMNYFIDGKISSNYFVLESYNSN